MKIETITFYNPHSGDVIGRWHRTGDTITSDLAVQDILAPALARSTPEEAWARYTSWSNGYISSTDRSPEEVAAAD